MPNETEVLNELHSSFKEFRDNHEQKLADADKRMDEIESMITRPGGGAGSQTGVPNADKESFAKFVRSRGEIKDAMTIGSDPDGGFTVYPSVAQEIGNILREISPMRQLAGVQTFETGDAFEEPLSTGAAGASWVGETEARSQTSTPQLKMLRVPANEIYAAPQITQRLIDDSAFDLVDWLNGRIAVGFAEKEGAAFVDGDGVGKPRGFLTYPTAATADDARDWTTLEYVPTGAASDFATTDPGDALVGLIYKLKAGYRSGAVWQMNRKTAAKVRKFKDADGNYLWANSLQAGEPDRLLGFAVSLNEDMPDVAADAYPIAFGNFREGYRVVEKPQSRMLLDPYTAKPHVVLYNYRRVGGDVRDFNAIKLLKVASS